MYVEIINPDDLPQEYIYAEIAQCEKEKGRKVAKAEFRDNGNGTSTQRFWFVPLPRFNRIRRITGYLVGDLNRFNNAKLAEVKDRVKHTTSCESTEGR